MPVERWDVEGQHLYVVYQGHQQQRLHHLALLEHVEVDVEEQMKDIQQDGVDLVEVGSQELDVINSKVVHALPDYLMDNAISILLETLVVTIPEAKL